MAERTNNQAAQQAAEAEAAKAHEQAPALQGNSNAATNTPKEVSTASAQHPEGIPEGSVYNWATRTWEGPTEQTGQGSNVATETLTAIQPQTVYVERRPSVAIVSVPVAEIKTTVSKTNHTITAHIGEGD